MKQRDLRLATALFVVGLLCAGALHVLDRLLVQTLLTDGAGSSALYGFGSTALFVGNLAVYIALLVWWLQSVRHRLLPSRGRTCLLAAAGFMLFFLLERAVKYRLAEYGSLLEHFCWYAYYVPLTMIPTLFLLTCLRMEPTPKHAAALRRVVWGIALALILAVVTNDLHSWMFRPLGDMNQGGQWGSYQNGPLWYVFYAWVGTSILTGLGLLARMDRRRRGGRRALPSALLLLTFGILYLGDTRLGYFHFPAPYYFPETFIFGMLGIFESCIRSRLIPFNENYDGFFSRMKLAAEITDPALTPVYATARPIRVTAEQRRESLAAPLRLDADTRLFSKLLRAGHVFWIEDEGMLRRLNEELADAAEVLETENDLLRYENDQAEQRARVDARNRVYARAAEEVYGALRKIGGLLEDLDARAPDYEAKLARVLFLFAYVKRRMNFVLTASERETVSAEELHLALEESLRFLTKCGIDASAERKTGRRFTYREAVALYDSFQLLAESLLDNARALFVSLSDDALRLMAECPPPEALPETPAAVEAEYEGGQLYLTVRAGEGENNAQPQ